MPSSHIQVAWLWEFDLASSVGPACEVTSEEEGFPTVLPLSGGLDQVTEDTSISTFWRRRLWFGEAWP